MLRKILIGAGSVLGLAIIFIMLWFDGAYVLQKSPIDAKQGKSSLDKVAIYYINMDQHLDRKERIFSLANNVGFPVKRVSGVNGKKLIKQEIDELADYDMFSVVRGRQIKPGEVGCYLSHVNAWKEFYESDNEYALILEDDANFDPQQLKNVINMLLSISQDWDICTFESGSRKFSTVKQVDNQYSLVKFRSNSYGLAAYLLNKKAAGQLLSYKFPIKMPVDYYVPRSWEFGFKFRGIRPILVVQDGFETNIQNDAAIKSTAESPGFYLRMCMTIYKIKTSLMRKLTIWY